MNLGRLSHNYYRRWLPLLVFDQWFERRKATLYLQVGEGGGGMGDCRFRFQFM